MGRAMWIVGLIVVLRANSEIVTMAALAIAGVAIVANFLRNAKEY